MTKVAHHTVLRRHCGVQATKGTSFDRGIVDPIDAAIMTLIAGILPVYRCAVSAITRLRQIVGCLRQLLTVRPSGTSPISPPRPQSGWIDRIKRIPIRVPVHVLPRVDPQRVG